MLFIVGKGVERRTLMIVNFPLKVLTNVVATYRSQLLLATSLPNNQRRTAEIKMWSTRRSRQMKSLLFEFVYEKQIDVLILSGSTKPQLVSTSTRWSTKVHILQKSLYKKAKFPTQIRREALLNVFNSITRTYSMMKEVTYTKFRNLNIYGRAVRR